MKRITQLTFITLFIIFLSCGSDDSITTPETVACFTIDKTEVIVGQEITISDCSENATDIVFTYTYEGQKISATESQIVLNFSTPGNHSINLKATGTDGNTKTISKSVNVKDGDDNFKRYNTPTGTSTLVIGSGITAETGSLYFMEISQNFLSNQAFYEQKITYQEVDIDYFIKQKLLIASSVSHPIGHCLVTKNNASQFTFNFTGNTASARSYTIKENGDFISEDPTFLNVTHGSIPYNNNRVFYGANSNAKFNPVIQIRDKDNTIIKTNTYEIDLPNAFIGDLIHVTNGYIGYGASFELNQPLLKEYTPVLYFFDNDLNLTTYKTFENSVLKSLGGIKKNELENWFHVEQLNSGNLVMYGLSEMIIANAEGQQLSSQYLENSSSTHTTKFNTQGLVNLGDSFVLSTKNYLRKFDSQGNHIKSIFFGGEYTPNLLLKNNTIFFISSLSKTEEIDNFGTLGVHRVFVGAIDKDLNFINLNK